MSGDQKYPQVISSAAPDINPGRLYLIKGNIHLGGGGRGSTRSARRAKRPQQHLCDVQVTDNSTSEMATWARKELTVKIFTSGFWREVTRAAAIVGLCSLLF